MEKHNPDWYQLGLWEYMLLANPDDSVGEKVMTEKEYFELKYGAEIATKTLPHITIANFLLKERMEDLLCKQLQNICNLQYAFPVMLNNYNGFPSHAIFIRVQNPKPFKELAKNLRLLDDFFESNDCPLSQLITKPYMTIARRLDEETYNKAIIEYAQRDFNDVFVVNQLILLREIAVIKNGSMEQIFICLPKKLFSTNHKNQQYAKNKLSAFPVIVCTSIFW